MLIRPVYRMMAYQKKWLVSLMIAIALLIIHCDRLFAHAPEYHQREQPKTTDVEVKPESETVETPKHQTTNGCHADSENSQVADCPVEGEPSTESIADPSEVTTRETAPSLKLSNIGETPGIGEGIAIGLCVSPFLMSLLKKYIDEK